MGFQLHDSRRAVPRVPSFPPSLLVVINFAHALDGEDKTLAVDGCLHVVVAFLSALPKIAETILVLAADSGCQGQKGSGWSRVEQSSIPSLGSIIMVSDFERSTSSPTQNQLLAPALGTTETK